MTAKKVLIIFGLILTLIAIAGGLYLVQNPQIISRWASSQVILTLETDTNIFEVGDTGQLKINLQTDQTHQINGFQIFIKYDPQFIQLSDQWQTGAPFTAWPELVSDINPGTGIFRLVIFNTGGTWESTANQPQTLLTIPFTALSSGSTAFTWESDPTYGDSLVTAQGTNLTYQYQPLQINISTGDQEIGGPVDPTPTFTPSPTNASDNNSGDSSNPSPTPTSGSTSSNTSSSPTPTTTSSNSNNNNTSSPNPTPTSDVPSGASPTSTYLAQSNPTLTPSFNQNRITPSLRASDAPQQELLVAGSNTAMWGVITAFSLIGTGYLLTFKTSSS